MLTRQHGITSILSILSIDSSADTWSAVLQEKGGRRKTLEVRGARGTGKFIHPPKQRPQLKEIFFLIILCLWDVERVLLAVLLLFWILNMKFEFQLLFLNHSLCLKNKQTTMVRIRSGLFSHVAHSKRFFSSDVFSLLEIFSRFKRQCSLNKAFRKQKIRYPLASYGFKTLLLVLFWCSCNRKSHCLCPRHLTH